jgi:hypothetical protein
MPELGAIWKVAFWTVVAVLLGQDTRLGLTVRRSGLVLSTIGYVLTRLVGLLRCTSALVYIGINAMGASSVKSSNT